MSDKDKKKQKDEEKIVHFPEKSERAKLNKRKQREEKDAARQQEQLEEEYRRQYKQERAARARMQSKIAQNSAAGKQNFINWDRIPPFTRAAIGVFLLIHIITSLVLSDAQNSYVIQHFGFMPAYYTGYEPWHWGALLGPFTTLLLHGGWMHVIVNSVMMMAMGVFFERQFGAKRTFIFFILCGMAGNLVYFILNPALTTPVVGASGAISGLFGATIMMMTSSGMAGPEAQKRGPVPFILLWITIIVVFGMMSADTAWQSHLGGFLGGIGLFQLWRKGKIRF